MGETTTANDAPVQPLALIGVGVTGVFASAALGAFTNAVNGFVSPEYFVNILHWQGVANVWRASIAQGIFEGLCFGIFFSLVFTVGAGIITRGTCSYGFAVGHLLGILLGALVFWVLGGLAAMGLASLSPEFYRKAFIGVPDEFGAMLRYAWVGGSLLGVEIGGLVSVVVGLVVMWGNWQKLLAAPEEKVAAELD